MKANMPTTKPAEKPKQRRRMVIEESDSDEEEPKPTKKVGEF